MAETARRAPAPIGRSVFARAFGYWPEVRRPFLLGLLCILPATGLELWSNFVIRDGIDGLRALVTAKDAGQAPEPGWWRAVLLYPALAIMAAALVTGAFKYGMRWWVTGASRRFERLFRQDLFDHLTTLTPHDLRRVRTGDVMSRSVADIEAVRMMLGPAVMYVVQALVVLPCALVAMAWIDWQLTASLLLPFAALAAVVKIAAGPTQRWSHVAQERIADLSTAAQENVSGIRVVKAFVSEAVSASVFKRMGQAFLESNVKLATIRGMTGGTIAIVRDLAMLAIVLLGGWHLLDGRLSLGDFLFFYAMINWALWPLIAIGWMLGMYHRARAGALRLDELFALQPSVTDARAFAPPASVRGELQLRDLSWSWDGVPALRAVSLRVPVGMTLGVTGRTGSGKSTLVQLISRQVEPPPGTVLLDGRDISTLPLSTLRHAMGVVPQDAFLFSESIRDNIAFARDNLDLDTVRALAATAHVDADIEGFPLGYDQLLGERGVTLSGGQRQRTAIARTLAADPPILILDDCLSAVDSVTEQAILRGLRETLRHRTAIVVSHRVASLSLADRIVVLDEGRVAEEGSHDELIARGGLYAELFQRQKLEQEIEAL
ncbi:MAG TPA: ABC transporter ATP-binding protein [Planctomycetota bacterium]|nr:ABC transporter ATP-binding protein [Planctomycetota bacterium]